MILQSYLTRIQYWSNTRLRQADSGSHGWLYGCSFQIPCPNLRIGNLEISEFINGIDVLHGHPHLNNKLSFSGSPSVPLLFRFLMMNPERMVSAAQKTPGS